MLYPDDCCLCETYQKKVKGVIQKPIKVVTKVVEETIKIAAKSKDVEMYLLIKDENLISKEFKYHRICYSSFTHGFSASFRNSAECSSSLESDYSDVNPAVTGNYEAIGTYINEKVLRDRHAISMKELHNIYGIHADDARYRGKLKKRIVKEFGNKITFLSPQVNLPDIIINKEVLSTDIKFDNSEECVLRAAEYLREDILQYNEKLPELIWPPNVGHQMLKKLPQKKEIHLHWC